MYCRIHIDHMEVAKKFGEPKFLEDDVEQRSPFWYFDIHVKPKMTTGDLHKAILRKATSPLTEIELEALRVVPTHGAFSYPTWTLPDGDDNAVDFLEEVEITSVSNRHFLGLTLVFPKCQEVVIMEESFGREPSTYEGFSFLKEELRHGHKLMYFKWGTFGHMTYFTKLIDGTIAYTVSVDGYLVGRYIIEPYLCRLNKA